MRACECGCGRSLEGRRPEARYATDKCRARAWKAANGYGRQKTVRTASATKRRRSPDLRISYRRAVDQITVLLAEWYDPPLARRTAEANLRELLTDRQRKALA